MKGYYKIIACKNPHWWYKEEIGAILYCNPDSGRSDILVAHFSHKDNKNLKQSTKDQIKGSISGHLYCVDCIFLGEDEPNSCYTLSELIHTLTKEIL